MQRKRHAVYSRLFFVNFILWFIYGCSGNAPTSPVTLPADNLSSVNKSGQGSSHQLWGYYEFHIDPTSLESEVLPVRVANTHFNALSWLESSPCDTCLKINEVTLTDQGLLQIDVQIEHPFDINYFSAFDVRGIAMFNGSMAFPNSGLVASNPALDVPCLAYADGYTSLYNSTTLGSGPNGLQGYQKGKLASETLPNATLNGFMRFPNSSTRNIMYPGGVVERTYYFVPPLSPFIMGYAIDANWVPPITTPVLDPIEDFPVSANSTEPYNIYASSTPIIGNGSAEIWIFASDWQGGNTINDAVIECPQLFNGTITALASGGGSYVTFKSTINNSLNAPTGYYYALVSVEAKENDPANTPWLDLTAYQLVSVFVNQNPQTDNIHLISAKSAGGMEYDEPLAISKLSDDSVIVTGTFQESATFGQGEPNETQIESNGSWSDIFQGKFNPDGTLSKVIREGGVDSDTGWTIATLSDDSVVMAGRFDNTVTFGEGSGNDTVLISNSGDMFVAKHSSSGVMQWAKCANGDDGTSWAVGIAVLPDDSTVVTGIFSGSVVFGAGELNETILQSDTERNIFTAKYSTDGALLWAKRAGKSDSFHPDEPMAISGLTDGSCVVAGWYTGNCTFAPGEANETNLSTNEYADMFLAKYDSDGVLLWVKSAGGTRDDIPYRILSLPDDSVVVTGTFENSAVFDPGEPTETVLLEGNSGGGFIARYNPNGSLAWVKRNGQNGNDEDGGGIAMLSDNSIMVVGNFGSSGIFGEGEPNQTLLKIDDGGNILIAKYNLDGSLVYAKSGGTLGATRITGIVSNSDDSITVIGHYTDTLTFAVGEPDQTQLVSVGDDDIFVWRFSG